MSKEFQIIQLSIDFDSFESLSSRGPKETWSTCKLFHYGRIVVLLDHTVRKALNDIEQLRIPVIGTPEPAIVAITEVEALGGCMEERMVAAKYLA